MVPAALAALAVLGAVALAVANDTQQAEAIILNEPGSPSFERWKNFPAQSQMKVYIYNVTNADEFLNIGEKPVLAEVGPYVYDVTWKKQAVVFNHNGTVSYRQSKVFKFNPERSVGSEDDHTVVVPNIPMLSATSQAKHSDRSLQNAMSSIMDMLHIKPFVEVSVGQLLWGYEDPLLKLAKEVVPSSQKLPYDEFGLLVGKNGTAKEVVTVFTGADDSSRAGLVDRYGRRSVLPHWKTDECNRIDGSDGSLFPPRVTKNSTLHYYNKDMCRRLPLKFLREVKTSSGADAYRFSPPDDVFADVSRNPDNDCFCPEGPPCAPHGLMNVSLCQYGDPVMLSFPHFHLADPKLREAVVGMEKPDPEKDMFYIDVDPETGVAVGTRARVQMNLAVLQVDNIPQVASFPDFIFPIFWFEEGFDQLRVKEERGS